MKSAEESLGIDSETYNKIVDECIYGEQKPADWSEEDEDMHYKTIAVINRLCAEGKEYVWSIKTLKKLFYWLKSLKDRVQPQKQEWSDVDKDILFHIIDNLKFLRDDISKDTRYAVNIVDVEREINWLKSLKDRVQPQNRWKPSEEQMDVLLSEVTAWTKGCPKQIVLESLYNDLKNLK